FLRELRRNKVEEVFSVRRVGYELSHRVYGWNDDVFGNGLYFVCDPSVLSLEGVEQLPDGVTRMDQGAVSTATAIAAAVGTLFMGIVAKYPIGLAPGMGLNAFFAYTVVLTYGIPWETALSGVLASGLIFIILTLTGLREKIINFIPG